MNAAREAVVSGCKSQRQAAKEFGVPRSTLQKLVEGKTEIGVKPGTKPLLGQLESKLVDYAVERSARGIGFGKKQFFEYATQLAEKHKIKFKSGSGRPSEKWWKLMKKRNERVRLRRPEPTASIRHMCMDASKVAKYFTALSNLMQSTGLTENPKQLWNMDETGLQLEHKPSRVVAEKGVRYLQARTSGNRETITVIACVNAAGGILPPHIIAKGKTKRALHSFDTQSAPEGATWSVSERGWTKQGIARLWFEKAFLPNIGPDRPQILVLDGHDSHSFVELIEVAMANQIEIVELPAHTSNWLQPCDRTVFKPFKDAYNDACQQLMNEYPGTKISHGNFCSLMTKAWLKGVTCENIKSGFRACGIYPFNPAQIPQEAYLPNTLYVVDNSSSQTGDAVSANETATATASDTVRDMFLQETVPVQHAGQQVGCSNEATENNDDGGPNQSNAIDVSLVTDMDTSEILEMADINLSNISIDVSHNFNDNNPGTSTPANTTVETSTTTSLQCPDELALRAIELSVHDEVLVKYKRAYGSKIDIENDPIFSTWKLYMDRCQSSENVVSSVQTNLHSAEADVGPVLSNSAAADESRILCTVNDNCRDPDSDILVMPKPQVRKKSSRKSEEKFFILTSREAYAAKVKQRDAKERAEQEKKNRKERKNKETANKESTITMEKKNQKGRRNKQTVNKENTMTMEVPPVELQNGSTENVDTTKCLYCEIVYCESTVDWWQCTQCQQWACMVCSRMGKPRKRGKPRVFVCDGCK